MKKPRGKPTPKRARAAKPVRPTELDPDGILPEYDFSRARPNEYAAQFRHGSTLIVLEPDVAAAFPNAAEVNELLRAVAGAMRKPSTRKRAG